MTEKSAYAALRRHLPKNARLDRIENLMMSGMPDCNLCLEGNEWWIEIKAPAKTPKRATTPLFGSNHRIMQSQILWHTRQIRAGGNSGFLICTDNHYAFIHGKYATELNQMPLLRILALSLWYSKRRPATWNTLYQALIANSKPNPTDTNLTA